MLVISWGLRDRELGLRELDKIVRLSIVCQLFQNCLFVYFRIAVLDLKVFMIML